MSFSSLAISASARAGKQSEHNADIIEFVEAPWGLKMKLFPVQKVILKAHYGLELDDTATFEISDWRRENVEVHTEKSYLKKLYDEGRCNVGEVIPGKQRREMILSIGRRSGKCVTGDTLIPTSRGMVRLDSLGDASLGAPEYQPLSEQVLQEGGKLAKTAFFYNGGGKDTKKIVTNSGFELEGTPNHRIKVLDADYNVVWKYLDDVKVGDIACLNRKRGLFPDFYVDLTPYKEGLSNAQKLPDVLTEDWAEMLGILVGDGTWARGDRVSVTVGCSDFLNHLIKKMSLLFGKVALTEYKGKQGIFKVMCHNKEIREFLHRLGWGIGTKKEDKSIPEVILKSPRSVVCAFFRGLFETDGCASLKPTKEGYLKKCLSLSSSSPLLLKESQILLMNLGVFSSRVFGVSRKGVFHEDGVLRIKGTSSFKLFIQDINFISDRKRAIADSILSQIYKRTSPPEWSTAPKGFGNFLKRKGLQKSSTTASLETLSGYLSDASISDGMKVKIDELLSYHYYFDEIKSVEDSRSHVYDLNVPDGSMFVGNAFTNHNTTISACIAAYETYKLIKLDDPQKYYGLPASNNIQIISVATDKDQAGLLYQEVSGHYRNCSFFGPYTANNTLSYARFQTPADVEKYGRYIEDPSAKATLKVTFRSCVAKGLRGAGNICVILDEVAHFTESGQSGAEEVYNAVVPSTSAYSPKDPNNPTVPIGEVQGRVILISSPLGKQGLFYNLFQIGMRGGKASENILAVQAPTWEVNPTVPAEEFEKHYLKNAAVFFTEYGGEFTDRTRGWIEKDSDLLACVDEKLKPKSKGVARAPHFMGIDLGLVGDGTAVAIGHIEEDKIVVDLVTQIKAGEGDYADKERLDFDDVADWVLSLSKKFYIVEGIFDQWAGIPFEQALAKRGLGQMKSTQMTRQITSNIFQNFKDMMWDERLRLYNTRNPEINGHEPYIKELLELQANVQSKHVVLVEAPQVQGKHDDMSDALTRMVWLASQKMGSQKYVTSAGGRSAGGYSGFSNGKGFAGGARLRAGSDAKRIPRATGRNQYSLKNSILGGSKKR